MPQLGVIGLGTMGANLARNAARRKATVVVYNRSGERTKEFLSQYGGEGEFVGAQTLAELCKHLVTPRVVLLMVKAGDGVEAVLHELLPLLSTGDIIIDGGNSHYRDTEKRANACAAKNVHFIGMGVSGGEDGALNGPSMMPGGNQHAVQQILPLFSAMAADDGSGGKCIAYLGTGGAGHFVKMVHNGIEYGVMQLLAECYDLLKRAGGMSNVQIADLFGSWSRSGPLKSFLLEISEKVLRKKDDETGKDLVDVIKDSAGQKGTGKWTTDAALQYGVAIPTINAAVDARIISSGKEFRVRQAKETPLVVNTAASVKDLADTVRSALTLSIANAYAQGFQLLSVASQTEGWNLDLPEIARIWSGGCIIRSAMLPAYQRVFRGERPAIQEMRSLFAGDAQLQWRSVVALGAQRGIPLPALSASLHYYDAYRTETLPQNLIQAQRDYFGAHTFERTDREGKFHVHWQ